MANTFQNIRPGSGVSSVNSITGAVTIVAGSGISVTPSGSNVTIASTGGFNNIQPARLTTGNVTVNATTDYIIMSNDASGGSFNITLPAGVTGMTFQFSQSHQAADSGAVYTFVTNGSDTLDGAVINPVSPGGPLIIQQLTFISGVWYVSSN